MVILCGSTLGRKKYFEASIFDVLSSVPRRGKRDDGGGARGRAQEESAQRRNMREDRSANIVVAVKAGEGDIPTAEAKEG